MFRGSRGGLPRLDLRTTRTIRSAIEIRAPRDAVWTVLTDFASYPEWNPHIRQVRGEPRVGRRLTIRSQPPSGRPVVLRPVVEVFDPPAELRWRSTFMARRLFSGEHGFKLESIADGRTRFMQDETVTGLLVPLYARLRLPSARQGFAEVNEALRTRAENATSERGGAAA
ncbi:MAG TPA: SRPBCC domain-containing protein [Candidatus Limnocylindrales bacterium]|nr:SRPBCC domain-containing protein [Candidatus Limnocylindrales bacterium]